jgi:hypothetical protein
MGRCNVSALRMEEKQWKEDSGETTKAENLLL